MNHTKGPWRALRAHQYCDESGCGDYFEPDEDDLKSPFVKIVSESGQTIVTNHDLFTFRNEQDAKLIAMVPEFVEVIEDINLLLEQNKFDEVKALASKILKKIKT